MICEQTTASLRRGTLIIQFMKIWNNLLYICQHPYRILSQLREYLLIQCTRCILCFSTTVVCMCVCVKEVKQSSMCSCRFINLPLGYQKYHNFSLFSFIFFTYFFFQKIKEFQNTAKDYVNATLQPALQTVEVAKKMNVSSLKELSWNKANDILGSHYGQKALSGLDSTTSIAEQYLDYYLPSEDSSEEENERSQYNNIFCPTYVTFMYKKWHNSFLNCLLRNECCNKLNLSAHF